MKLEQTEYINTQSMYVSINIAIQTKNTKFNDRIITNITTLIQLIVVQLINKAFTIKYFYIL